MSSTPHTRALHETSIPGLVSFSSNDDHMRCPLEDTKSPAKANQGGHAKRRNAPQSPESNIAGSGQARRREWRQKRNKKRRGERTIRHCERRSPKVSSMAETRVPEVKQLFTPSASAGPQRESSPATTELTFKQSIDSTEFTASRKTKSHPNAWKGSGTPHSHRNSLTSDLSIYIMRQLSPQLEHIVSSTSPKHIASAASLLLLFQARSRRLNRQIDAFQAESKRIEAVIRQDQRPNSDEKADLKAKLQTLEEMHLLASGHWYELFELECSLRDVIDKEESGTLIKYVARVSDEIVEMVQAYEAKIREIMARNCPEVVGKMVDEVADARI